MITIPKKAPKVIESLDDTGFDTESETASGVTEWL